jgi:hypothetical protein
MHDEKAEEAREFREGMARQLRQAEANWQAQIERNRAGKARVHSPMPAVERARAARRRQVKAFRMDVRRELVLATKLRDDDRQRVVEHALSVRAGGPRHGDAFTRKVEITQTRFLDHMSDEEARKLLEKNREDAEAEAERKHAAAAAARAAELDRIRRAMDELAEAREVAHALRRKAQDERRAKEAERRLELERAEGEALLALERRLEKKQQEQHREAAATAAVLREMKERNTFQERDRGTLDVGRLEAFQDGAVRAARERQGGPWPRRHSTVSSKRDLAQLRQLVGLR